MWDQALKEGLCVLEEMASEFQKEIHITKLGLYFQINSVVTKEANEPSWSHGWW